MKKHCFFQNPIFFIFGVSALFIACSGSTSSHTTSDSSSTVTTGGDTSLPAKENFLTGHLDTLWIDSPAFKQLTKRVTFRFYIDSVSNLTLHGWSSDTVVYKPAPDVTLLTGRTSKTIQYGKGNYFGNLVLKNTDIDSIRRAIKKTGSLYVLFAPVDPATTNGQINYNILLTNDDPHPLVVLPGTQSVATGLSTNPSPPRNSN